MKPAGHTKARIAYFISPHGYGHAARACGIIEAIHELDPTVTFELLTTVPRWFFEDSVRADFAYHALLTDVGLVQRTPLHADLTETVERLNGLFPCDPDTVARWAERLNELECDLIVCEIAPMGIAVSVESGIPCVLVENFTWDWIYQEYVEHDNGLARHIEYLGGLFDSADYHIQTEPVCRPRPVDLVSRPVSRKGRTSRAETRERLGIPEASKAVLITMGGVGERFGFLERLAEYPEFTFVMPGGAEREEAKGNLILLPHHSGFYHPDLVNACDCVVGKVGYSTLAEVYHAGVPFGFVARRNFRESEILVSYIEQYMSGLAIEEETFYDGSWASRLHDLINLPKQPRHGPRGATQAAHFICNILRSLTKV